MAAETTTSGLLLAKLGDEWRKAFETHKNADVKLNNDLPPDVYGIAQLDKCGIIEIKKGDNIGKLMFFASGRVITPKEHEGGITRISEPMHNTPSKTRATIADHWAKVREYLANLGVDVRALTLENVEPVMAALLKRKPTPPRFKFHTWCGAKQAIKLVDGKWHLVEDQTDKKIKGPYPSEQIAKQQNPHAGKPSMVNHQWDGVINYVMTVNPMADVVDNSGGGVKLNGTHAVSPPPVDDPTPPDDTTSTDDDGPSGDDTTDVDPDDIDGGDIDSQGEKANNGDTAAAQLLTDMALAAGVHNTHVAMANSWIDVVDMIRSPSDYKDSPMPDVGSEWYFFPNDPHTKTKGKKRVTVVVDEVSEKNKTATLTNKEDGKTKYKGIKWNDLIFFTE